MLDGVRQLGLFPSAKADRLRARVSLLRDAGHDLPDMTDTALMETLDDWLLPHLTTTRTAAEWKNFDHPSRTYRDARLPADTTPRP